MILHIVICFFDYDWFWMNCLHIFFFLSLKENVYTSFLRVIQRRFCFYLLINALIKFVVNVIRFVYKRVSMDGLMYSSSCLSNRFKWHSFATASTTPKTPTATVRQCRLNYECLRFFHRYDWVIWMKWKPLHILSVGINKCCS